MVNTFISEEQYQKIAVNRAKEKASVEKRKQTMKEKLMYKCDCGATISESQTFCNRCAGKIAKRNQKMFGKISGLPKHD